MSETRAAKIEAAARCLLAACAEQFGTSDEGDGVDAARADLRAALALPPDPSPLAADLHQWTRRLAQILSTKEHGGAFWQPLDGDVAAALQRVGPPPGAVTRASRRRRP